MAGSAIGDYGEICARLDGLVDMIELNISCPNVRAGGMALGIRPENIEEVASLSKKNLKNTPLIVKLSPNVENIALNAKAAECGGADAISLVNTFTGMVVDLERRKPVIANNTGGVSGAGIKPIALRMVYEAAHAVKIPVIGMGGIMSGKDALEFMCAGAESGAGRHCQLRKTARHARDNTGNERVAGFSRRKGRKRNSRYFEIELIFYIRRNYGRRLQTAIYKIHGG